MNTLTQKKEIENKKQKLSILIAGPCSAETEIQLIQTAVQLAEKGVKVFRAGIWKPRTRPGSFEGVGSEALKWMQKAKKLTGMETAVEVANTKHVYQALKAGIDVLWIGARTTTNPFAVQEIAEALAGVDIPVMIKNPINPDVNLWIGAFERFQKAGINRLSAIHRGFSSYQKSPYRNIPAWQIPIELRRCMPGIPIICDPSHIGGKRDLIAPLSQTALDLDFDGLMIESHIAPDRAWSDAKQQITPTQLGQICRLLKVRRKDPDEASRETLEALRAKIDHWDNELLQILHGRMQTAEAIGSYKKARNMTVLQSDRWSNLLESHINSGKNLNLSPELIEKIFKAVHIESINKQKQILQNA